MITKKSLVGAVTDKIKTPVSTLSADKYGWRQSLSLGSGDVPSLQDKKVGDKVCIEVEGTIKSAYDDGKFNIEINKVG